MLKYWETDLFQGFQFMDAKDKAECEAMASDLIKALKFRDIASALEFFHPDDRAELEESIRQSLEESFSDLPDGDPVFEWAKTSRGEPVLNLTNSNTEWGMGWFCCFRDGRWWLS